MFWMVDHTMAMHATGRLRTRPITYTDSRSDRYSESLMAQDMVTAAAALDLGLLLSICNLVSYAQPVSCLASLAS